MKKNGVWRAALPLLAAAAILLCFVSAVSGLEEDRRVEGKQQLEDVLRRTAAACYAAEGTYPPSLDYMREHYGIRFDEQAYTVYYHVFASNLMPDITVLDSVQ